MALQGIPEDITGNGIVTGSDVLAVQNAMGKIGIPDWWHDAPIGNDMLPYGSTIGTMFNYIFATPDAELPAGKYEVFSRANCKDVRGEFVTRQLDWSGSISIYPEGGGSSTYPPDEMSISTPVYVEPAPEEIDPHNQYDLVTVLLYGTFTINESAKWSIRFDCRCHPQAGGTQFNTTYWDAKLRARPVN